LTHTSKIIHKDRILRKHQSEIEIDDIDIGIFIQVTFLGILAKIRLYPRDAMLARVIEIATCPSVCLSICLSVRPSRAGILSKRRKLSSPSVSPKTLVFRRQISSPNSKGLPPQRGPQTRVGRKNSAIF